MMDWREWILVVFTLAICAFAVAVVMWRAVYGEL